MKINVASNWNPAITPVLTNPGNRRARSRCRPELQLTATDPNGDELGYGASGLPTGLTLNAATGAISGTPTASGNFNVVVAASDGINTATQAFVWTIADPAPLQVQPPPPPAPLLFGGAGDVHGEHRNGLNAQVRWDFDDGTPVTRLVDADELTHTFTRPGVYYVTVTAIDDRGVPVSQTFVQAVHLPLTANRPTASGNIAWEPRAARQSRVGRQPGQRHGQRLQRRDQREGRRDRRRRRAAQRRGRAERPHLGDEQAGRIDQHHRSEPRSASCRRWRCRARRSPTASSSIRPATPRSSPARRPARC